MDDLVLVALPTAVTCTELFVQFALTEWSLLEMQGEVKQVARELVNAAVANNDPRAPRFLTVRLSLAGGNLTIEVEDGDINWRELPLPVVCPPRRSSCRAAAVRRTARAGRGDGQRVVVGRRPGRHPRVFAALSRSAEPE